MPTATINGVDLSYTERGSGTPLVLLHGFPLDSRVWRGQVEELSSRCRVITPDLRGFGRSPSDAPFTLESQAEDVRALLATIKALPCVLGGLSMGGYITLAFARKYLADLRGVMLVDTKAEPDTEEGKQGRMKMVELARSKGSPAVAEQMMPKMLNPETGTSRPQVQRELREIMEACPAKTIEHALLAMRDRPDSTDVLATIAVPSLVIVGEADAITPPPVAEAMVKRLPKGKLAIIRGAGHMAPMEQAGQVNRVMREFMDEVGK